MKMKILFFSALLALGSFQIALAQTVTPNVSTVKVSTDTNAPEIQKSGYLIGPGDEIKGKVLGEDQFNFTAIIDEDGKFQVPFFEKSIMAKCRTEKELRSDVTQLLSKYLKTPLVSVSVTDRKSRLPTLIYGEVRNPQQVTLMRKARLLELLALAGGVTEKSGGEIQIFHTQPPMCDETYEDGMGNTLSGSANAAPTVAGNSLDFPFRVYSLGNVQQGSEQSNPVIYPGDIIVVKEALPVFIVGEVIATGKVPLPEGGLPLTQALATVGGVRPEAKTKDIKIYRLRADSKERDVISANYDLIRKGKQKDVMLSPYDIVEVGKAKKSIAQTILEIAIGSARTIGTSLPTTILR